MWRRAAIYGGLLAAGTLALEWLDYERLARALPGEIYVCLIAAGFLGLGVLVGARVFGGRAAPVFDGNPTAQAELKISRREMTVLK